jgi:hypothetical protein
MTKQQGADNGVVRRQTPSDVLHSRAARQLIAPVHQKISAWHAESVKLEMMAMRARMAGRRDARITEAAQALRQFIAQQSAQFERDVQKAPDPIREHDRIADTRKVLDRLQARLDATLGALGSGGQQQHH